MKKKFGKFLNHHQLYNKFTSIMNTISKGKSANGIRIMSKRVRHTKALSGVRICSSSDITYVAKVTSETFLIKTSLK
jgi:hypothetical protein